MTTEELKEYITTDEPDKMLAMKLEALELKIRRYTNNNFQNRGYRVEADIRGDVFMSESLTPFAVGDTIMVSESDLQSDCLAVVTEANELTFVTDKAWSDDDNVLVTKVEYPVDVKLGVIGILKWQLKQEAAAMGDRTAMPVQSETLSRYSVTYAADASDTDIDLDFGVPKKLLSFLKPFEKARF
jgi:hypothetical protein